MKKGTCHAEPFATLKGKLREASAYLIESRGKADPSPARGIGMTFSGIFHQPARN